MACLFTWYATTNKYIFAEDLAHELTIIFHLHSCVHCAMVKTSSTEVSATIIFYVHTEKKCAKLVIYVGNVII